MSLQTLRLTSSDGMAGQRFDLAGHTKQELATLLFHGSQLRLSLAAIELVVEVCAARRADFASLFAQLSNGLQQPVNAVERGRVTDQILVPTEAREQHSILIGSPFVEPVQFVAAGRDGRPSGNRDPTE